MRRLLLLLALVLLPALPAYANDVYITQAGAGTQAGTSCANAKPLSYFNTAANWSATPTGILIGPDTTVHVCGTNTVAGGANALDVKGSGTSGHPVTVFF